MNAIILSIGDELVLGQTVDTNSAWLSGQLATVGCAVTAHITVADSQADTEEAIRSAAPRCDYLIVSGGLGPTDDDLTRQALAAVLGSPLEINESWLRRLDAYFKERGRAMPERNKVQALIPRGATMIENTAGTAPGIDAFLPTTGGRACRIFVMPGVPKEMRIMFARDVLPHIAASANGSVILSRTLHTFGLGESAVAEKLGALMDRRRNPSVGTTVANGIVSLRLNARFTPKPAAQEQLDRTEAECRKLLGDLIFGEDDQTLPEIVAKLLLPGDGAKARTVATAESCTGGWLAKMLTDVSGSSAYFTNGWVVYSNDAKHDRLGVSRELIGLYGAVSEPVVQAMATGAMRLAKSDYALAISGIAGPTGGTPAKPVGLCCYALAHQQGCTTRTIHMFGDREMVRDRAAKMALTMLRFHLLGKPLPF
jgi:nicotinamide-nucleotide amidase